MRHSRKPAIKQVKPSKTTKTIKDEVEVKVLNAEMLQGMCQIDHVPITPSELYTLKSELISTIAGSILREPKLAFTPGNNRSDNTFITDLIAQSRRIALYDPEFLLKAALYARTRLNLRSVAAFLLSLAALIPRCHPYLPRYFRTSVLLPSDWLDVARRYRVLHATLSNADADDLVAVGSERSLPACLRKSMTAKFADFDAYQLGKYNPQRSNARKRRKFAEAIQEKTEKIGGKSQDLLEVCKQEALEYERSLVDFKELIRDLHIVEPAEYVMCVLGKKYPSSEEEFRKCRLSGVFEEERAGQRMKLPVAETWETFLSSNGNTAETWESLIDHGKLPFMAMIRNIRNLLLCGVERKCHDWVIGKLRDAKTIASSKQLPFRFVSAYRSVPGTLEGFEELLEHVQNPPQVERASDGKMVSRRERKHVPQPKCPPTLELLTEYRKALETAIQHATTLNVAPIRGKTVIMCEVFPGFKADKDKFRNTALLLALMCRSVCEYCDFIFVNSFTNKIITFDDDDDGDKDDGIIARLERANKAIENLKHTDCTDGVSVVKFIHKLTLGREWVDTIVYFGSSGALIENDVNRLRAEVNASMLFFSVDPEGKSRGTPPRGSPTDMNIRIAGASDSVLRYIAELGGANQVEDVEHINREFGIVTDDIPPPPLPSFIKKGVANNENIDNDDDSDDDDDDENEDEDEDELPPPQMWKEARIFVSSTFLDMHGERDLLTRIVYPELAKRCEEYGIRLSIVDLRWGITDSDQKAAPLYAIGGERRPNPQRCLEIVEECAPLFVGFVGERYGWHPAEGERYPIDTKDPRFAWVASYPLGRSATELEMYLGCAKTRNPHAFFYFRDPAFMDTVPAKYRKSFAAESKAAGERVATLKDLIRCATDNVVTYPATWGGIVDGVPVAKCSNALKRRLFNDMWGMIKSVYNIDEDEDKRKKTIKRTTCANESDRVVEMAQRAAAERLAQGFIGRQGILEELSHWVSDESGRQSVAALCGPYGSGMSSLCAVFAARCRSDGFSVVEHHVSCGGTGASKTLRGMLTHLCLCLERCCCHRNYGRGESVFYAGLSMRELEKRFGELLEEASYTTRTVVVIDSPDDLASDDGDLAHSLGWLPGKPPGRGCKIVLAVRAGGVCESVLRAKYPLSSGALRTIPVGALEHDDALVMVRQTLGRYKKKLSESSSRGFGGNQMAVLLGKADAGLPLYLKLACEELRVFGVYDALNERIKALSGTLPGLVDEILTRFENDHGRALVANALAALALSRQGLYEAELLRILAPAKKKKKEIAKEGDNDNDDDEDNDVLLSQGRWAPLCVVLRAANIVTQTAPGFPLTLSAAGAAVRAVVERRYLNTETALRTHTRIAECLADKRCDEHQRLADIVHHYIHAKNHDAAAALLTSLAFVQRKIELGMGPGLLADYAEYLSNVDPLSSSSADVAEFRDFVAANMHVLSRDADLTYQMAANEPDATAPARAAAEALNGKRAAVPPPGVDGWIKWINKPQQRGLCKMRLGNEGSSSSSSGNSRVNAVSCVAFSATLVAYGCNDCAVRVHDRTTGKLLATLTQHSAAVSAVAFSDDGEALAAGAWDGSTQVWSTRSWAALPAPLRPPQKFATSSSSSSSRRISALAFPPGSCSRVLGASWDSNIYIWDFTLGSGDGSSSIAADPSCYALTKHRRPVSALCIAEDGRHAASGAWDGSVLVWDIGERRLLCALPNFGCSVRSLAWRPDTSDQLVIAATNGSVELWNTMPPVRLACVTDSGADPVNAALYCGGGSGGSGEGAVATGAEDGAMRLWSASSAKPVGGGVHALSAPPKALVVAEEGGGRTLLVPAGDCMTHLWTVGIDEDCALTQSGKLSFHTKVVNSAASCVDFVVTASDDGKVVRWNRELNKGANREVSNSSNISKTPRVIYKTECPVNDIALIPPNDKNKNYVVVCALEDSRLVVVDCKRGTVLRQLKDDAGHKDSVRRVAVSPDGTLIASAGLDGTVCLWNSATYAHVRTIPAHKDWVTGLAFSPSGTLIATSSLDSRCQLFDVASGALVRALPRVPGPATAIAFSPSGALVAAACSSGAICVWDSAEGFLVSSIQCPSSGAAALCFLSERVLAAATDSELLAWKLFCPHELGRLTGHNGPVRSVALTPDATVLATAADDGAVCLWDVGRALATDAGQRCWQEQNHASAVTAAAFASGGEHFATAGADGSLKFWNAAAACVRTFYPTAAESGGYAPIRSVAFLPGKTTMLAGDADGVVHVCNPDVDAVSQLPVTLGDSVNDIKFNSDTHAIACSWDNSLLEISVNGDDDDDDDGGNVADVGDWSASSVRVMPGVKVSGPLCCGAVAIFDGNRRTTFYDSSTHDVKGTDLVPFLCSAHIWPENDVLAGAAAGDPATLVFTLVAKGDGGALVKIKKAGTFDVGAPVVAAEFAGEGSNVLVVATADGRVALYRLAFDEEKVAVTVTSRMGVFMTKAKPSVVTVSPVSQAIVVGDVLGTVYLLKYIALRK